MIRRLAVFAIILALPPASVGLGEAADEQDAFFEKHIRPTLVDHCYECHSQDNAESELQVDSLAGLLKGGLRGPAIVPGKPEQSLLIRAVRHGVVLQMPPKQKLPREEIARLAAWIRRGAAWPNARPPAIPEPDSPQRAGSNAVTAQDRKFWAFQSPRRPTVPAPADPAWVRTPIDAFILQRLESQGIRPATEAPRVTLLRRAAFALTGLPPTRRMREEFLKDPSPNALERIVNRLLASPQYGERWGRHWLDVARYADSNGLDENLAYGNAYRYRDYVVDAFNRNLPFDVLVREQLAGDLLNSDNDQDYLRRIAATGFLCIGPKMLAEDDPLKLQMDIVDEQIDTVGRAFIGMTLGCARCHDHKFDPISTADYYALAGIFKSTKTMDTFSVVARWHERPIASPQGIAQREELTKRAAEIDKRRKSIRTEANQRLRDDALGRTADYLLAAENERRRSLAAQGRSALADSRAPGIIRIEAEDYARGNVLTERNTYGKGIGVLVNRGETPNFVEYDIDVKEGGVYQIETRYAAAAARPTKLLINGRLVSEKVADGVTGSWNPDTQRWEVEGLFELRAGKNIVRLEQPLFFPHIDKLQLAKSKAVAVATLAPIDSSRKLLPELATRWRSYLAGQDAKAVSFWKSACELAGPTGTFDPAALARKHADFAQRDITNLRDLAQWVEQSVVRKTAQTPALREALVAESGPLSPSVNLQGHFDAATQTQLKRLDAEHQAMAASIPEFPEAMSVEDGKIEDVRIHVRGSHLTQTRVAPRGFPAVFSESVSSDFDKSKSGRLQLARWLTEPDHPLTARVFVNRVWRWHFGAGLVRSTDNFGRLGERPTHPELLDWLAVEFVESGWDVKQLHRLILSSAVWRQSSTADATVIQRDPVNRYWARSNRRRLEAEAIRDAILTVSDQLDYQMGGSLLPTQNRKYVTSTANVDPVVYETARRSVYLPVVRSALYDVFQAFDFADPSALLGDRQSTTVAPQALFMMNSKLVSENANSLAAGLLADEDLNDRARLRKLYETLLARRPLGSEQDAALRFVSQYAASWEKAQRDKRAPPDTAPRQAAWRGLCRTLLGANEFVYLD